MAKSNSTAVPHSQFAPGVLGELEKQVKHLHYAIKVARVTPVDPQTLRFLADELRHAMAAL